MKSILVPIHHDVCAHVLLQQVGAFAAQLGASVVLLHSAEPAPGVPLSTPLHSSQGDGIAGELLVHDAFRWMKDYGVNLDRLHVEYEMKVVQGTAAEVILRVAEETGVDLIAMGTHGRTGLARLLRGSVSEHVLRHANVPVMTLRTQYKPGCEASSCAWCTHKPTGLEAQLEAEADG